MITNTNKISYEFITYDNVLALYFTEYPEQLRTKDVTAMLSISAPMKIRSNLRPEIALNEPSTTGNTINIIYGIGKQDKYDDSIMTWMFDNKAELEKTLGEFEATINICNEALEKYFENSSNPVQPKK